MGSQIIASNALYIMALLPLSLLALVSGVWWRSQKHPYIFVVAGIILVYALMYVCVSNILTLLGISGGRPGAAPLPAITPTDIKFLRSFALFIVLAVPTLWASRYILNKL